MSGPDDRARERLEQLARAAANGESIEPERDAGSLGDDVRALAENLGVVARIAGARAPEDEGIDPPGSLATAAENSTVSRWANPDPQHIGPYRIVGRLGEGGMGIVYEAEQRHPRRPVALKVIRGGHRFDSHALRLFQREIQTLARLTHPGIAQLYEAGATDDGMHYFAMELIRGAPLSEWLRQRGEGPVGAAELRLRLGLFRKICDAVAFAHQKGVIHRDLKPGNILIPASRTEASTPDAVPEVKILDFGLARMTDTDVQMSTFVTEVGKVQGTLPYMSPEQVRGNADEIDLRSDVYSLGVILYQMLAGRLPLDVSRSALPDAMRIICEQAPRSLTTTFSGSRPLDADVATIVGKCLEKEAARRYQSAAALAEDIQRYLSDLPIQARPPSAAYQFRKLVRRHKGPFAAAAGAFVLLVAFSIAMSVQAARLAKERDRADREAQRAKEEAKRASEEAATAKSVSDFLEGMFKVADPAESRGTTITAKEILDRGAARIEKELADQPIVQMRLVSTMFRVYERLALIGEGSRLVQAMQPLIERYPDRIESADLLGWLVWINQGKPVAIDLATRSLQIRERVLPPTDPRVARGYYFLGLANLTNWRLDDATRAYTTGLARLDAADHDDPELRVWCLNDLAISGLFSGDVLRAHDYFKQALTVRKKFYPPDAPERINGENYAAYADVLVGNTTAARPVLTRLVPVARRIFGDTHWMYKQTLQSLAELERREGNLKEAKLLAERARENGLITLALTEEGLHHSERAVRILENAIETKEAELGAEGPWLLVPLEALKGVLTRSGRSAEAALIAARADRIRTAYKLPATAGTVISE